MERTKAMLVDITKCIGCRSCEQACKEVHGFLKDTEARLSTTALTVIEGHGDKYVRADVHALPGSGVLGVPGGRTEEDCARSGYLR